MINCAFKPKGKKMTCLHFTLDMTSFEARVCAVMIRRVPSYSTPRLNHERSSVVNHDVTLPLTAYEQSNQTIRTMDRQTEVSLIGVIIFLDIF